MRNKPIPKTRWALSLALIGVLAVLVMGAATGPGRGSAHLATGLPHNEEEARAKVAATEVNRRMADMSLEVREQIDFLLTPALLVQEAVSDDVILTYPEE
jgi:hypothetical protein